MVTPKLINFKIKRPAIIVSLLSIAVTYISGFIGKLTLIIAAFATAMVIIFFVTGRYKAMVVFIICFAVSLNLAGAYTKLNDVRALYGQKLNGNFVVTSDSVSSMYETAVYVKSLKGTRLPAGLNFSSVYYGNKIPKAGDIINADIELSDIPVEDRKGSYSDGIYADSTLVNINFNGKTDLFYKSIGAVRRYVKRAYLKYVRGDSAALLIAITLGDKSYLSNRLYGAISDIGISHMVAVSGFHLAIIIGNLFLVLNRFVKNKYLRFTLKVASVLFITAVCGFTKSIMRAGTMFLISAAAQLFGRESDSLSSLALSIPAVFLFSPFSMYSIGFNLSVISTFALIYIAPYFINKLSTLPVVGNKYVLVFFGMIVNSFFAALYASPVLIKVFKKVSVISVFSNLLLNYFVTFALVFGALALLNLPIFEVAARGMFYLARLCADIMIFLIKGLSELPVTSVKMGNTAYYISLFVVAAITVFVYYANKFSKEGNRAFYGNSI